MKALILTAVLVSAAMAHARPCTYVNRGEKTIIKFGTGEGVELPTVREVLSEMRTNPRLFAYGKGASYRVLDKAGDPATDGKKGKAQPYSFDEIQSLPTDGKNDPACRDKSVTGWECRERDLKGRGFSAGIESPMEVLVPKHELELRSRIAAGLGCDVSPTPPTRYCLAEPEGEDLLIFRIEGGKKRSPKLYEVFDAMRDNDQFFTAANNTEMILEGEDGEYGEEGAEFGHIPTVDGKDVKCRSERNGYECMHKLLQKDGYRGLGGGVLMRLSGTNKVLQRELQAKIFKGLACRAIQEAGNASPAGATGAAPTAPAAPASAPAAPASAAAAVR